VTAKSSTATVYKNSKEQDLIDKVEPVLINLGYLCRDIEVVSGRSAVVRITIERDSKEMVSIDDCATVHRTLGPMFDVWDPLPTAYTLEVSSPGEKPRLRNLSHFREAVGGNLRFQTLEAIDMPEPAKPRKNWEGELLDVQDSGEIRVKDSSGVEHTLKLESIKNATWMREWTASD